MKKFFLIVALIASGACSNDDDKTQDPIFCTEEARPGLEIIVKDGIGGAALTEGVTVIATDGEYTETLESFTGSNSFVGAHERTGSYTIMVSKDGYNTFTSEPVIVDEDVCHVITENLEVILEKK